MSFDEVSKLVNIYVDDLENYKQYQDNKGEKSDKKESNKIIKIIRYCFSFYRTLLLILF